MKHPSILIPLFCSDCDLLEEGRCSWEAKGRQQGRQGVLVLRRGTRGLSCHRQSTCNSSLLPPHPADSQPEPGTRGVQTEHRERRDTPRRHEQLTQTHGQQNQSSGIFPTMRCTPPIATTSPGAGRRWKVKETGSCGACASWDTWSLGYLYGFSGVSLC